jgi:integrase
LRLDWSTVDLPAGRAHILVSKPDRWVEFELSPDAVAALAALGPKDAGKVFPWIFRSAVYEAVDKIAPEGMHWRPHESRRAVVTAILKNTGDPTVARDFVAHASLKTTLRYRVVDPAEVGPTVRIGKRKGKRDGVAYRFAELDDPRGRSPRRDGAH